MLAFANKNKSIYLGKNYFWYFVNMLLADVALDILILQPQHHYQLL